ncbi:RagB/SusD family nutrient uptake outer membrane protein [Tellurirhabdus bombi]|uniref:RagB/SusD family nutrient uptake outer membrane protein n=1 Tax=Tellurirhabdus bombi TaxID=2907205 RepID=UPI001F3CAB20|nr:RagB/SusD family nutrient uptake outer membrane protein [Tellurirhabdus bombi]
MKKIKYLVLAVGLMFSTTSCEDYLERYPLEGPADQSYFTNASELELAVNGCYKGMNFHVSDGMPLPLLLDNCTDISWDRNNSAWQQIGKGAHDSNNGFTRSVWNESYKIIGRCNFILDNMNKLEGKMDATLYARYQAEARFVRAFMYHYLIELFGGVPLVTKTIGIAESQIPKSTKEECATFIMNELDEAAKNLPNSYDAKNNGRAVKAAALATKARTALFNAKWDVAAKAAKDVMDLNTHKLHANFGELFSYRGQTSSEIIFALQYLKGTLTHGTPQNFLSRNAQGASNKVPGQALVDSYECTDGLSIDKSPLYNSRDPFKNRDPRLDLSLAVPGSNYFNFKFETHKDSVKTINYTTGARIDNQDAIHAFATYTGYCWRKYTDLTDKDDRSNSELNVILLRYAEVLLTYAEAKIEANQIDQSVYDAINAVRQRPTVNMPAIKAGKTQAELRSIVRKERKYELANEGVRLIDIRRWKIAEKVMSGNFLGRIPKGLLAAAPAIDENGTPDYSKVPNRADMRVVELRIFNPNRDYLWPIPYIETVTNKALVQNTGY